MEKLTSILAVAPPFEEGSESFLVKALTVARAFDARIDQLLTDAGQMRVYTGLCAGNSYRDVMMCCVSELAKSPAEVVLRMASRTRPDLVIKRAAGPHPLRRLTFGLNDWQLARDCPAPLLLVRDKPWSSPPRFAAAVDVAEGGALARAILHSAGFLALGCDAPIDVLYSEREQRDEALRMSRAVRLSRIVREFHVGGEHMELLSGDPARTLPPLIAKRHYDVLALGSHMAANGVSAIAGTLSSRLAETFDGDVLFVNDLECAPAADLSQPVRWQAAL